MEKSKSNYTFILYYFSLMKKLLLFLFLSCNLFVFYSFASYTPTVQDQVIVQWFQKKLETILTQNVGRNILIADQVKTLQNNYKTNERIYYVFGEIAEFIRHFGTTIPEIEAVVTIDSWIKNDCDQSLWEIVKNYQKQTFVVSSESEIRDVIAQAKLRVDTDIYYEILIKKWTYHLDNGFWINTDNIIFRGETNDPKDVVLIWKGMQWSISHGVRVVWDDVMIGDLSISNVANHAIQIHGERDADNVFIHNVEIFDTGEQMIKWSHNADNSSIHSNNGTIQCSKFYYSAGVWPQYYIGGIDVHNGKNRTVSNNTFRDIISPESRRAEHTVHFWSNSENTVVENNTIINCDRWIGFGLWDRWHQWGIIRGNMIYHDSSKWDVGIWLESASNITVEGNTIFIENSYPNAIEYRFAASIDNIISNNITNKLIRQRDGAQAILDNNILNAEKAWFSNPNEWNIRLKNDL